MSHAYPGHVGLRPFLLLTISKTFFLSQHPCVSFVPLSATPDSCNLCHQCHHLSKERWEVVDYQMLPPKTSHFPLGNFPIASLFHHIFFCPCYQILQNFKLLFLSPFGLTFRSPLPTMHLPLMQCLGVFSMLLFHLCYSKRSFLFLHLYTS